MTTWDPGLVKVVNAASAAVSQPQCWNLMLKALEERFGATACAIFERPDGPTPFPALSASLNLPPDGLRLYLSQWSAHDPWLIAAQRAQLFSGNCFIGRELCDWPQLERSDFYNEFSKPQEVRGLLSLLVDDGRCPELAPSTLLSLYRRPGLEEFTFDDRLALKAVHAPLQMALRAHFALGASRNGTLAAAAALDAVGKPIFVLDSHGRLLHANAAAHVDKVRADWLVICGDRLVQLVSAETDAAPTLVCRAALGQVQTVRLWRPAASGGVRCAAARLVPLGEDNACRMAWPRAAVLLLIDEQAADLGAQRIPALTLRYRLTATESQMLAQLGDGLSLADIASVNGVSIHTVRTHLKHLFEKFGVGRQSDLIRLLSGQASSI